MKRNLERISLSKWYYYYLLSYRQMEGSNLQSPSVYLLSVLLLPHATSNSATCRCLTCPRMVCMGHFHDFLSLMLLLLSSQSDWGNHFFLNQNLDHLANLPRVTYKSLLLGIITSGSSIFPFFFCFPCNLKFIRTLVDSIGIGLRIPHSWSQISLTAC